MIKWFTRGLAWLSQGFNWLFLNGNHDQTVSARCYINRNKSPWKYLYITINTLVFWQDNHCFIWYELLLKCLLLKLQRSAYLRCGIQPIHLWCGA